MEIIQYKGENVYTSSINEAKIYDLMKAKTNTGEILDAYFFKLNTGRKVEKIEFDKTKIEKEESGLLVDVKNKCGQASVSIIGLDRITQFLYDSSSLGNLSSLKGKEVKEYNNGIRLLGISIKP